MTIERFTKWIHIVRIGGCVIHLDSRTGSEEAHVTIQASGNAAMTKEDVLELIEALEEAAEKAFGTS